MYGEKKKKGKEEEEEEEVTPSFPLPPPRSRGFAMQVNSEVMSKYARVVCLDGLSPSVIHKSQCIKYIACEFIQHCDVIRVPVCAFLRRHSPRLRIPSTA